MRIQIAGREEVVVKGSLGVRDLYREQNQGGEVMGYGKDGF